MSEPAMLDPELPEVVRFHRWNKLLFLLIAPALFYGGSMLSYFAAVRASDGGGSYGVWFLSGMLITIAVTAVVVVGGKRRLLASLEAAVERHEMGTGPTLR